MADLLEPLIFDSSFIASKLREGAPCLFPTDTLPALATLPEHAYQLWKIKCRSIEKPLILMGCSAEQLFEFVLPIALEDAGEIARKYWPGALTMVVPAFGEIVKALNPIASNSLGLRVPACELARDLLIKSGPLATTSANLSGASPILTSKEASAFFPGLPLLGPMPWPKPSGLASTVICWKAPGSWQLLRKGAVIPERTMDSCSG